LINSVLREHARSKKERVREIRDRKYLRSEVGSWSSGAAESVHPRITVTGYPFLVAASEIPLLSAIGAASALLSKNYKCSVR
jgi:nicotinic acid phosphoribosyltransferase